MPSSDKVNLNIIAENKAWPEADGPETIEMSVVEVSLGWAVRYNEKIDLTVLYVGRDTLVGHDVKEGEEPCKIADLLCYLPADMSSLINLILTLARHLQEKVRQQDAAIQGAVDTAYHVKYGTEKDQ